MSTTTLDVLDDIRWDEDRQARHAVLTADESRLAQKRSEDTLQLNTQRLANLEMQYKNKKMPTDVFTMRSNYIAAIRRNAADLDTLQSVEKSHRAKAQVHGFIREVPTYGKGSPFSEMADLVLSASPGDYRYSAAVARLQRGHAERVAKDSTKVERALRSTVFRRTHDSAKRDQEVRAGMDSTSGSGGSFVTPRFDVQDYGISKSFPATLLDESTKVEDQGYGLELYIPVLTAAATTGQQSTENAAVTNSSPTGGYQSTPLITVVGEVDASLQLLDRAGPVAFDSIIKTALLDSFRSQVDSYIAATVVAAGGSITGASTFTAANLYGDVAKAKALVATDAGVRLPTTHIITQTELADFLLSAADPGGRPITLPAPVSTETPPSPGHTGATLLSVPLYTDSNIAFTDGGTRSSIVVANLGEVFVLVSDPVFRLVPEVLASTLGVALQLYGFAGCIVRHANAVQVVGGTDAYPATPTFA